MTTAEKIAVMQAYEEGKQIQANFHHGGWENWNDDKEPTWDWINFDYRIKPELKYRPYENTDEMIEDFKQRFNVNVPKYAMPLIWIKSKANGSVVQINAFHGTCVNFLSMVELFAQSTYLDGSPVGKVVEE